MWFKSIRLYTFTDGFVPDVSALETALQQNLFRPCSALEQSRVGWVNPVTGRPDEEGGALMHQLGAYVMVCLRKQEKILPATVVNESLLERVADIEAQQDRKVYRKEKAQLKDEVITDLLPRAFVRNRSVYAYLSVQDNMLVVNGSSAALAEELISALRDALGSFPVRLLDAQVSPMARMTEWLKDGRAVQGFVIDQDCELVNPLEDGNVIRCKSQDLFCDEVAVHLRAGKQVSKLGVVWNDAVRCVINADLTLSRVRFEDEVIEQAVAADAADAAQQFDQDFAIMTLTLSGLINALQAAFAEQE